MSQEKSQLYKEFEREVWLYLDNELPKVKADYWNQKLEEFPDLHKCIEEYLFVSELYNEVEDLDITTDKFNFMVDKAVSKKSFWGKVSSYSSRLFLNESEFTFGKIAFASALIIMAVVVSLISNSPNPVVNITKTINAELLDWDADFVDNQIGRVGELLKITKDEQYRKYSRYGLSTTSVEKNIKHINANIEVLRKEINNKEL